MTDRPEPARATIIRARAGEHIPAGGVDHLFKLTGRDTADRFGVEEFLVPAQTVGARPHVHWAHDEYFYVLDGELTVATADGEAVLTSGDFAHAPRGSIHGYRNAALDSSVRALCMYTPPGYEHYFRDVHRASAAGGTVTDELLQTLRGRYNTETI